MSCLNYEFFDEFKALDNLCRDIYGESTDNKLGVTLYLEDMDRKACQGAVKVSGWTFDYNQLKSARNIRNELAHSRNSFSTDICSQENIDFIRSFRTRILNQTDPIALLKKQTSIASSSSFSLQPKQYAYSHNTSSKMSTGCLGIVALFLIVVACAIIIFLL